MVAPELARNWKEWWASGAARNFNGDKGQKFFLRGGIFLGKKFFILTFSFISSQFTFTVLVGVTKTRNTRAPKTKFSALIN